MASNVGGMGLDGGVRVQSNAHFIADAGAVTVLLECRHCSARFLRTSPASAKAAMADHLLAVHPGTGRAGDLRRDRRK